MSHAAEKSHIPDATLANLTTEKLRQLYMERRALSDELYVIMRDSSGTPERRALLEKRIENHDAAYEKLFTAREDMLDSIVE
jgi:hypothetical protein